MNLLPWFVRSWAGLRESDTGLTKGTVLVCNGAVQRSDGQAKADTDLIHPVTRECATDAADGLPMLWTCHTAAKAPHRLCASSPGASGAFALEREYGFRWASQGSKRPADISELAEDVPGPFRADAHRRGTVPTLCPLWGQDSPPHGSGTAIRLLWAALCLGGNRAGGNPQGYATVPLPDHRYLIIIGRHWDFLKNDPVGVCPS